MELIKSMYDTKEDAFVFFDNLLLSIRQRNNMKTTLKVINHKLSIPSETVNDLCAKSCSKVASKILKLDLQHEFENCMLSCLDKPLYTDASSEYLDSFSMSYTSLKVDNGGKENLSCIDQSVLSINSDLDESLLRRDEIR